MTGLARLHRLLNMRASLTAVILAATLAGCVNTGPARLPVAEATRANVDLAQDFLDLTFRLETGQTLDRLLKYEGPVRVSLDPALSAYEGDLKAVLSAIRRGAGINIAQGGANAQIHVFQVPAAEMRAAVPGAACLVAPAVRSWAEFQTVPRRRWSTLTTLGQASVFIPDDASPYSVRACLNEEIAQALGPVNDLYRLPDTVFNDDNIHLELTSFDLLILRILYSNKLQNGASRDAVVAMLPSLLSRLNPSGNGLPSAPRGQAPAGWERALETSLNANASDISRAIAARTVLNLSRQISPADHRVVLSLMIAGRFVMRENPREARTLFSEAHRLSLAQLGPNNLRSAQTAYHLAATMIGENPQGALDLAAQFLPVATRAHDAPLEAGLYAVRAIAYLRLGQRAEANVARLASIASSQIAFGTNDDDQDPLLGFPTSAATN